MNFRFAPNLALSLAIAFMVAGCSNSGTTRLAPTETRNANGFTIQEFKSVGFRVNSQFEEANQAIADGNLARGIDLLIKVTEDSPGFASAHINLAIAYQQAEKLAEAEAALRKAIDANPRHPVAHNELGIVYRRTGRFVKSRESFEAALELQPTFHFARKNLAVLCDLYLADLPCALKNYRIYFGTDPTSESVAIWIADLEGRIEREGG
jgi:tetratricopeptide (TPR) repeat protein